MANLTPAEQDDRLATGLAIFLALLLAAVWPWSEWSLVGGAFAAFIWDSWEWRKAVRKP